MSFALLGGHTRPRILLHEPEASVEVHQEEDEDLPGWCRLQGQEIREGDDSCRSKFLSRLPAPQVDIHMLFLHDIEFKKWHDLLS